MKKTGFTLAEVLITLGVIGVVAAITMPILIKNHQKQQAVTQLKKVYSILNQAYKLSEVQNSEHKYWKDDILTLGGVKYTEKYFVPFLNGIKRCNDYTKCGYKEENPWRGPNGNSSNSAKIIENGVNYILLDGTFLTLMETMITDNDTNKLNWLVDLNGFKGPNIYGKDVFLLTEDATLGFVPGCHYSYQSAKNNYTSGCNRDGWCCAVQVIEINNWKISDDYPW